MVIKRGKLISRLLLIQYGLNPLFLILIFFSLLWISPILIIMLSEKLSSYQQKKTSIRIYSILIFIFISVYFIFIEFKASQLWHGILLTIASTLALLQVFNVHLKEKAFRISSFITTIMVIGFLTPIIIISDKNSFNYRINEDSSSYTITHYIGNKKSVKIPSYYKGLPVTKIEAKSFMHSRVKNVTFAEDSNVIIIGWSAFASSNLRSITLPESLLEIENGAFSSCRRLAKIVIPKSVDYIGNLAFDHCDELKIYCEAESKPAKWDSKWNKSNNYNVEVEVDTTWSYKGEG